MMTGFPDYTRYDGLGLAELVRTKQVSPAELVEEAIRRIEQHNPALNAVVYRLYEQARAAANAPLPDGPFAGVPFLIKDLMAAYAGVPLTSGSRFMRNYIPKTDTEIVRRYKASGAMIVGKTNTPEFGLTPYTESELFGPARNPWDTSRTPGGSSGGSGGGGGRAYGAHRRRRRRRRVTAYPGFVLRHLRAEAHARAYANRP
jgi:amidase